MKIKKIKTPMKFARKLARDAADFAIKHHFSLADFCLQTEHSRRIAIASVLLRGKTCVPILW